MWKLKVCGLSTKHDIFEENWRAKHTTSRKNKGHNWHVKLIALYIKIGLKAVNLEINLWSKIDVGIIHVCNVYIGVGMKENLVH